MTQLSKIQPDEEFKSVSGFSAYEISNYGRLRSTTKSSRFAKTGGINYPRGFPNPDGYIAYCLSKDGKQRFIFAHVLVARAFLLKPRGKGKLEVNHKDFDKMNNHVSNLEWSTHKENMEHCSEGKRFKDRSNEKNPNSKLLNYQVEEIRALRLTGKTLREICEVYGISNGHASRICTKAQRK